VSLTRPTRSTSGGRRIGGRVISGGETGCSRRPRS